MIITEELELENNGLKLENHTQRILINRLKRRIKILEKEVGILLSENMLPEFKRVFNFKSGLVITNGAEKLQSLIKEMEDYINEI